MEAQLLYPLVCEGSHCIYLSGNALEPPSHEYANVPAALFYGASRSPLPISHSVALWAAACAFIDAKLLPKATCYPEQEHIGFTLRLCAGKRVISLSYFCPFPPKWSQFRVCFCVGCRTHNALNLGNCSLLRFLETGKMAFRGIKKIPKLQISEEIPSVDHG